MAIGNYTDQQVKDWMAGKSDAEVASQAASMGLNQSQIQQAYQLSGKNYTANDINGYASANGYSWGSNGGLTTAKAPAPTPVVAPTPAPAANPYADIDAYMAKQLTANPGLKATNYSPAVYGSMYQEAAGKFGVNGTYATPNAAYYSSGLSRTITPEEIKSFAATKPNDQQLLAQAQRLGWDHGTLVSAMKSAGMDMSDPKFRDGVEYRLKDSLDRGTDGYSVGNGIGGHQTGNGAVVAGGGNHFVDDGNGSGHWASNGPTQSNGMDGVGYGPTQNGAGSGSQSGTGAGSAGPSSSSSTGSSFSASSGTPQMNLAGLQGATNMGVDPKTQTVAGQLQSVLASDSPLIQQARTRALQSQNANGRLNSTMSQSAADSAMYDAAMGIAVPDANTYNLAAQTNAATANTFGRDANAYSRQQDMANFNVNANNWAAQQEAARQAVRDAALNAQGVANSATATTNQMTAAQTAAANAERASATSALNNARAEFASKVATISMDDKMDEQPRIDAIASLRINYNAIITNSIKVLGWGDPGAWLIK